MEWCCRAKHIPPGRNNWKRLGADFVTVHADNLHSLSFFYSIGFFPTHITCLKASASKLQKQQFSSVKDLGTFCKTNNSVHRFALNLIRCEDNDSRRPLLWYYLLRCCGFREMSKQCHGNTSLYIYTLKYLFSNWDEHYFCDLFSSFSKTTAPQHKHRERKREAFYHHYL